MKYQFTDDMMQISGFGSEYEGACVKMFNAGLSWLENNPTKNPLFQTYTNVCGVIEDKNEDAKELLSIVSDAEEGCTGAMIHGAIWHIMKAKSLGWEAYVAESKRQKLLKK